MSTKQRILVAAERLFASRGVESSSLKMVTEAAQVNLAAVNYHFGSKQELVYAVFDDLADRISRRRLALLAARKLSGGGKPLSVEEIVYYFMEPYVLHEGGRDGALLINMILHQRVSPTRTADRIITRYFDKVAERFVEAFGESIPHLDPRTLWWRYYFMVSSILFTYSERGQGNRLAKISGGHADLSDVGELTRQLTLFLAGGMVAPLGGGSVALPEGFDTAPAARAAVADEPKAAGRPTIKKQKTSKGEKTHGQVALRKRTARSR
jgi:AcrR family transcriptional regulator